MVDLDLLIRDVSLYEQVSQPLRECPDRFILTLLHLSEFHGALRGVRLAESRQEFLLQRVPVVQERVASPAHVRVICGLDPVLGSVSQVMEEG